LAAPFFYSPQAVFVVGRNNSNTSYHIVNKTHNRRWIATVSARKPDLFPQACALRKQNLRKIVHMLYTKIKQVAIDLVLLLKHRHHAASYVHCLNHYCTNEEMNNFELFCNFIIMLPCIAREVLFKQSAPNKTLHTEVSFQLFYSLCIMLSLINFFLQNLRAAVHFCPSKYGTNG